MGIGLRSKRPSSLIGRFDSELLFCHPKLRHTVIKSLSHQPLYNIKMPSHLRLQSSIEEPISANATYQTSRTLPPAKKQKMSLTQTYYVASTARSKLGREASRADHNLRLLVGHANLLDQLMVDLADAEKEQEAWFNQTVQKASKPDQPKHIQWLDEVVEEDDSDSEDESDDESDDGSIYDEEEFNYIPLRKLRSPPVTFSSQDIEESQHEIDAEEDEEDIADGYPLERVPSHSVEHSPPELLDDSESDDDQDTTPPSPESEAM